MNHQNHTSHDPHACREYNGLSRRRLLQAGAAAALWSALGAPAWLPRVVFADSDALTRDIIISIFLRGGADGLTLCAPFAEPAYYQKRPTLAVPPPDFKTSRGKSANLNGFFALPPAMAPLIHAYRAGHLAVVHATGSTDPSRSHFDAQRFMEIGKPGATDVFTGWLGRHLDSAGALKPNPSLRGIGIGYSIPKTLEGGPLNTPVPNLASYGITGPSSTRAARLGVLNQMYAGTQNPLLSSAQNTQKTISLLQAINFTGYQPGGGAVYPDSSFGRALKYTAALIRAQAGVEAVAIDKGGWDTHAQQGPLIGAMATLMTDLAQGLAAFHADIVGSQHRVVVVVMSEFGRRVAENGSDGTDHGHGNAMFVIGQKIAGGKVLTQWPGLANLYQNLDLQVTTDFRDILAEIVQKRLGNSNLAQVFPGFTPTFRGITAS